MIRHRWIPLAWLALAAPVWADEPDPREILRKADEATRALRAVSYQAEFFGQGQFKEDTPRIAGTVQLEEASGEGRFRARVEGRFTAPASGQTSEFLLIINGERVGLADKGEREFVVGQLPAAAALISQKGLLVMQEYVHPTPFEDELNGRSAKYEGTKTVGDVECDVIFVVYADGTNTSRWYFDRKDHLPRRVDRGQMSEPDSARVLIVTRLDTRPDFKPDAFEVKAPEGFRERSFGKPKD